MQGLACALLASLSPRAVLRAAAPEAAAFLRPVPGAAAADTEDSWKSNHICVHGAHLQHANELHRQRRWRLCGV